MLTRSIATTAAVAALFTVAWLCRDLMAANSVAPQVWLAGLDPISRNAKFPGSPSDYLDMFQPDAA
jgi:hypothetical protein